MMQRALAEAGIERAGTQLAVFERGRRQTPVVGNVISVGLVDEISDRQYVIVDGIDGRVHYAELGRVHPDACPARDMIVSLTGDSINGRPKSTPRLKILSTVALETLSTYDGPTWLDTALSGEQPSVPAATGFTGRLEAALEERRRWLVDQRLAERKQSGEWAPKPELRRELQRRERLRIEQGLSRDLNAPHVPYARGSQVIGVYERAIATPTGTMALIRREDTFTLAPWTRALEAYKGRVVIGSIGPTRTTWSLDRGRGLGRRM